ncbi:hypothetical protein GQR58_026355 [Nymphon striatum]|nr:hypothetical protein GQR58_026355 [Nymphon striatum]
MQGFVPRLHGVMTSLPITMLTYYAEASGILPDFQFGFRADHSAPAAIFLLKECVMKSLAMRVVFASSPISTQIQSCTALVHLKFTLINDHVRKYFGWSGEDCKTSDDSPGKCIPEIECSDTNAKLCRRVAFFNVVCCPTRKSSQIKSQNLESRSNSLEKLNIQKSLATSLANFLVVTTESEHVTIRLGVRGVRLKNDTFETSAKMSLVSQDIMDGYHQPFSVVEYP